MQPGIRRLPRTWPTQPTSAPLSKPVRRAYPRLFPRVPQVPKRKLGRYSLMRFRNTNNPAGVDQALPLPPLDFFFFATFITDFFVVAFLAPAFLAACSPTMGRSFISAARHIYQLATLRYGRQRSPYASKSLGLGKSANLCTLAKPFLM